MHVHVLGLGPIGCLLAHNLRRVLPFQHAITLIHKTPEEQVRMAQNGTITILQEAKKTVTEGFRHEVSFTALDKLNNMTPTSLAERITSKHNVIIDSLFVALKAQHTVNALKDLAPRLSPKSTVVLFQNGMGIYERLVEQVFRNPEQRPHIILASNTHGAFVKTNYNVVHSGQGSIQFGIAPDPHGRDFEHHLHDESVPIPERRLRISDVSSQGDPQAERYRTLRETVAALLLMQELNVSWQPLSELQLIMQRKLVVNAAINPLSAIFSCRNGELFKVSYARDLLIQICEEASAVFEAKLEHDNQTELQRLLEYGHDTSQITLPTLPEALTPASLEEHVLKIAELTSGNVSSMLQDVRTGRKTEVEFINGYIEDLGAQYGVATPVIGTLRNLVKLKYFIPMDQFL